MKIRNIRFQNISTLKGQWEINFDQSPFAESGIFAITGPNGAGKTTVLDSLTLALYGETPRLKNPGEEIMSRDSAESSSEVTFSVNDALYRAQWQIRRKGGKANPPEMKLFSLNGHDTLLDDRPAAVRSRIAELTGLDFKRFCRSVMLAQGEFAAFLQALDSERAEILGKIIGPEVRAEYVRQTLQKADSENEKFLRLKEEIENFSLPDPIIARENQDSFSLLQEQLEETEQELSVLEQKKDRCERWERLRKEYTDATLALASATERQEDMQEQFRKLAKARKAAPIQPDMESLVSLDREKEAAEKTMEEVSALIPVLEEQIQSLDQREKQGLQKLEQASGQWEEQKDSIENALEITKEIETVSRDFREKVERYETLEKEQNRNLREQDELKNRISENDAGQKEIGKWLSDKTADQELETDIPLIRDAAGELFHIRMELDEARKRHADALKEEEKSAKIFRKAEHRLAVVREKREKISAKGRERENTVQQLLSGNSLQDIENRYKAQKEKLCAAKKLLVISKDYSRQLAANGGKRQKLEEELSAAESQYADLSEKLSEEENILITLRHANAALKYEAERALLKEGEPCPLCGSTGHPFVTDGLPYEGNPGKALKNQENRIADIKKQMDRVSDQIETLQKQSRKTETLREEWEKLFRNAGQDWVIEDVKGIKKGFREIKKETLEQKIHFKSVCKHGKKAEKYQRAVQKKSDKVHEKQMVAERLRNDLNIRQGITATLVREAEEIRSREQAQLRTLQEKVEKYGEKIPDAGKEETLIPALEKRKALFHEKVQISENLKAEAAELSGTAQELPESLKLLKKEADELEGRIRTAQEKLTELENRQKEVFGSRDPVQAKEELQEAIRAAEEKLTGIAAEREIAVRELSDMQQKKEEAKAEHNRLQRQKQEMEQILTAKSLGAGFSSIEEARENLMPVEEQDRISNLQKEMEQTVAENRARSGSIREMLEAESAAQDDRESPEIIHEKIREARKVRDQLAGEADIAEKAVKQHQAMEQEYAQKRKELEDQEKRCQWLNSLKSLVESGNEPEIRQQIQHFMLNRLLDKSNRHMEELSGHYYIRRRDPFGMSLEIEDIRHRGMRRPVKTLSGGESFLASLSLALGLSEMACSDRKIESLFLDEGFGMLDDETLYRVISALKNIKANGKMVGVISHVKRLEDEIRTQIRIDKQPDGLSQIEIVA
ncbi:MAG: AAA family ATPase [Desulfococcaceae bacterium]